MATQTTNYGFTLPNYDEIADIDVINENMDLIDKQMKRNADGVVQAKSIVSDAYSGSLTYNVGDYCIYDNKLYRCITAVTTAEAFDSAKWQETSVKSELSTLNSNMGGLTFELKTIKSQRNSTYTNLIQVYVANIKGKKVFVTPSSNITLPSAISRINIYDNVLDITFFSELAAETDYYFDLLIVSV